jgi:hypothetical protein
MPFLAVEEAIQLIQMEYAEMPELRLTFWQARRLWNLSDELCQRALATLTRSGFLALTADGAYVRSGSSPISIERIASIVRAM